MSDNLNYIVIIAIVVATIVLLRIKENRDTKRSKNMGSSISISSENIPLNLRGLVPLLNKWSVSDDNEREKLLAKTTNQQKIDLIATVYPLMDDINKFLDSFEDKPPTDEAIRIGDLAQLVSELKIEMDQND